MYIFVSLSPLLLSVSFIAIVWKIVFSSSYSIFPIVLLSSFLHEEQTIIVTLLAIPNSRRIAKRERVLTYTGYQRKEKEARTRRPQMLVENMKGDGNKIPPGL